LTGSLDILPRLILCGLVPQLNGQREGQEREWRHDDNKRHCKAVANAKGHLPRINCFHAGKLGDYYRAVA